MTTKNQAAPEIPVHQTEPEISAEQTAYETLATPVDPKIPEPKSALVKSPPASPDGARIQHKREACRLSRYALERRCQISASTIRLLEYGRAVRPSTLSQIERYLDGLLTERGLAVAEEPETPPDTLR